MSDTLDRLVRESRPELGTHEAQKVNWTAVDAGLFQRIADEQRAERAALGSNRGGRWAFIAGALAVAAAAALVVGTTHRTPDLETGSLATSGADEGGAVIALEGGGQLLVDGKPAAVGTALHLGNVIEARGAQATIERPGKLTLVFERGAKATVTHVQGALVLALERGAVEAQVVPVPSGEAFAVDVGRSRVAVHGTHLRVARVGEHVVVDLNEGVVSLGDAPRVGSTLGTLVTAPAHAEFTTNDVDVTLAVTHDSAGVRAPVSLASSAVQTPAAGQGVAILPVLPSPTGERIETRPGAPFSPTSPRVDGHPTSPPHTAPVVEVSPEVAIGSAVRSCLAERPRADNVTVVVSTTVHLSLTADGTVSSARFDPPVAPDVNACASGAIYRVRFGHGGNVSIPVDLRLPSSAP